MIDYIQPIVNWYMENINYFTDNVAMIVHKCGGHLIEAGYSEIVFSLRTSDIGEEMSLYFEPNDEELELSFVMPSSELYRDILEKR